MKLWNFLHQNNLHVILSGDSKLGYVASIKPFDGNIVKISTGEIVTPTASNHVPRKVLMDLGAALEGCKIVRAKPHPTLRPISANNVTVD